MSTRRIAGTLIVAALALAAVAPAPASAASMSCTDAKRAVKRELMRTKFDSSKTSEVSRLSCQRLSSTRAKVRWHALTKLDIAYGNVSGHSGYAMARRYTFGVDVTVFES